MLRAVLNGASAFGAYAIQYEKDAEEERCFVVFWEDGHLKKVCIGSEPLEQPVSYAELTPLSRFVCCLEGEKHPVSVVGVSPSLLRVLSDSRVDGKRFVVCQSFNSANLLQCVRQAHQDVSGMVKITTLVDYTLHRLKRALYEEWTEGKVVLRKCVRQGCADFCDLRAVLTDLTDLWRSIRPYIRCNGKPEAKASSDRVGVVIFLSLFLCLIDGGCRLGYSLLSFYAVFLYAGDRLDAGGRHFDSASIQAVTFHSRYV